MVFSISTLTIIIVAFYVILLLVLVSISQFIIRGIFKIEERDNILYIYRTTVDRVQNTFEFIFYPFLSIYLISTYFIYNLEWINIFIGIVVLLPFYRVAKDLNKEKGRFFHVPYRQIEISTHGILVNNNLLVYDTERDRIELTIKKLSTSRSIYYAISITNNYNSIEFIRPIPSYQYKTFMSKLNTFFTNNGFTVHVNEKEK